MQLNELLENIDETIEQKGDIEAFTYDEETGEYWPVCGVYVGKVSGDIPVRFAHEPHDIGVFLV